MHKRRYSRSPNLPSDRKDDLEYEWPVMIRKERPHTYSRRVGISIEDPFGPNTTSCETAGAMRKMSTTVRMVRQFRGCQCWGIKTT